MLVWPETILSLRLQRQEQTNKCNNTVMISIFKTAGKTLLTDCGGGNGCEGKCHWMWVEKCRSPHHPNHTFLKLDLNIVPNQVEKTCTKPGCPYLISHIKNLYFPQVTKKSRICTTSEDSWVLVLLSVSAFFCNGQYPITPPEQNCKSFST